MTQRLAEWWRQRQSRKYCFHHDTFIANGRVAMSWIKSELVDLGRHKRFWCTQCRKVWIV